MGITRKIAVIAATTALAGATAVGVAQASPAAASTAPSSEAPSACRPANYLGTIAIAPGSAGHRHYRVTLTAAAGYDPCRLAGSPTGVRFAEDGTQDGVIPGVYGDQGTAVTFGPGHPVHFDVQVPDLTAGQHADEVDFTLRTPGGGIIPGEGSAYGSLLVAPGTLIGPVQAGA